MKIRKFKTSIFSFVLFFIAQNISAMEQFDQSLVLEHSYPFTFPIKGSERPDTAHALNYIQAFKTANGMQKEIPFTGIPNSWFEESSENSEEASSSDSELSYENMRFSLQHEFSHKKFIRYMLFKDGNMEIHRNKYDNKISFFRQIKDRQLISYKISSKEKGIALSSLGKVYTFDLSMCANINSEEKEKEILPENILLEPFAHDECVIAVSIDKFYNYILTIEGELYRWSNSANSENKIEKIILPLHWKKVVAMQASGKIKIALLEDGSLYAWSEEEKDNKDQLIIKDPKQFLEEEHIIGIKTVLDNEDPYVFALTKDGKVYAWGDNCYGQLTVNLPLLHKKIIPKWIEKPTQMKAFQNIKIAGVYPDYGIFNSAIDEDGNWYMWGQDANEYQPYFYQDGTPIDAKILSGKNSREYENYFDLGDEY